MSLRCLIVTDARPAESGAPRWRRFAMVADYYREAGLETVGLCLAPDGERDAARAGILRARVDAPAFAAPESAAAAAASLEARFGFDVVHAMTGDAIACRGVRVVETPDPGSTDADVAVLFEPAEAEGEGAAPQTIVAPLLRAGFRRSRPRVAQGGVLAGVWVEADEAAIGAARSFFAEISRRGGGFAPSFVIAGPGAALVAPPRLPTPVTTLGPETTEQIFHRGLDLAVFPDLPEAGAGAPRYDVIGALELGATPLAPETALTGLRDCWRLPRFSSLEHLAEYLFEKGRDLREGGLLAELRARADWTWSGVAGAASEQRRAFRRAVLGRLEARG